ncbi:MAG: hypothetical protein RLZZ397_732 [Pseudomonadota bacterium]
MKHDSEILILGAGIAGASLGYALGSRATVLMLEAEDQPGYHSTGRSAAHFIEGYGPPGVRALSRASAPFFKRPPSGFAEHALLEPRGVMTLYREGQESQLEAAFQQMHAEGIPVERLTEDEARQRLPVLPHGRFVAALLDPTGFDMDVHAIHQGYLRGFKQAGGKLVTQARAHSIKPIDGGWQVGDEKGRQWTARVLVNAAGAWADQIAQMAGLQPLNLQPKRRSAWTFHPPSGLDIRHWPLVLSSEENWYIKPDAGVLLGSPANADPVEPQDVQPEIEDIAAGIERIESDLSLPVGRPIRTWAGLRTFSPHGEMVGGYDPHEPNFFWVVGQGGYGIQTSAAMGRACANLLLREPLDNDLVLCGVNADVLKPVR